jgi:hypothetical protein
MRQIKVKGKRRIKENIYIYIQREPRQMWHYNIKRTLKIIISQSAGFEPARALPIGFKVQRLNHSATTALYKYKRRPVREIQNIGQIHGLLFHLI